MNPDVRGQNAAISDRRPALSTPRYLFVAVRRDIPPADQMVQVAHAAFEAGQRWHADRETCHLILLSVPTQAALIDLAIRCEARGIGCVVFDEPDDHMGFTALCSEPLRDHRRRLFRRYPLWA
jgi:hypothetical protein